MRKTQEENFYNTKAIIVLPDHLHALWKLPEGDDDYSLRWRKIKTYFTQALLKEGVNIRKNKHGECDLWQRRYWEHTIRDEKDYMNHVNYIHYNPVKHGYVRTPKDWRYSSFHRYIEEGLLPSNWAEDVVELNNDFGE